VQRLPELLQPVFVLLGLTDCCLLNVDITLLLPAANDRYANLLLAMFVYILEEGIVRVSKQ